MAHERVAREEQHARLVQHQGLVSRTQRRSGQDDKMLERHLVQQVPARARVLTHTTA